MRWFNRPSSGKGGLGAKRISYRFAFLPVKTDARDDESNPQIVFFERYARLQVLTAHEDQTLFGGYEYTVIAWETLFTYPYDDEHVDEWIPQNEVSEV